MADGQIGRLSVAPVGWLFVFSSRQLSTADAARTAHSAMVLSRGASDIQPAARFSCRPTARPARHA